MTERHKTLLPQRVGSYLVEIKASVFPLETSTCLQRLNPIPLLASKGEEGDVIPTGLSAALRVILLQSLSTWEKGVCVNVYMRLCEHMCIYVFLGRE